ncbi:MAG: Lrp/AsnC family transcriptional regulator [Desulfuromonadales bacterium]|uniref:Lrp/AsnC family transcriptional regulator n=1 Tax=Desulfuromonas sp. AOP6 TaxID=1566351 RepID=UPI00127CC7BB|nr:Lrp/AsnC family transcriptional regulator [Desulfuromonas sp. AOP6]MDW7645511.1 Lrp/AsnC family transcriptional regulator [Desulfuromonadales bacterium]MDW7757387.1 Lrp/AsnC family transcriptional regulator [Desulfuromonadales bacterium]BCA78727.1 AsnC family transcriptional regulator [Desulfuromonas sp. AOP6]
MFDDIDLQILHILQEKARIPNAEVARQVGMAPSAVLERIRKLEERGIIEGYEVRLNPRHFGQKLTAFILVEASRAGNGRLAGELAAITGVQEVHQVAGEDGYLVKIRVAGTEDLGRILRDDFMAIQGVISTRTQVVLSTIKETRRIDLEPPPGP